MMLLLPAAAETKTIPHSGFTPTHFSCGSSQESLLIAREGRFPVLERDWKGRR